jgi:CYTH domain-containing protein
MSTFTAGILNGVIIVEIEQGTEALILLGWVGKEITGNPYYKKIAMRARALKGHGCTLLT